MNESSSSIDLLTACGDMVTKPDQTPSELYQGERIYFCMESCRRAFLRDPERWLAGKIPHFAE